MPIIIFFKINELILLQLGNVKLIDSLNPMCDGVHTNNSFNNNDLARFWIMFQKCKKYRHFYTLVIAELNKRASGVNADPEKNRKTYFIWIFLSWI